MSYEQIENYGVIGDLNTIALLGLDGSIDFMCVPEFDSPSIFAALLDDTKGGSFSIMPQLAEMKTKQQYLPDTNVLLTRFLSSEGVGEITDFMPVEEMVDCRIQLIRRVTIRVRTDLSIKNKNTMNQQKLSRTELITTPNMQEVDPTPPERPASHPQPEVRPVQPERPASQPSPEVRPVQPERPATPHPHQPGSTPTPY
jgi:hypothetical protein